MALPSATFSVEPTLAQRYEPSHSYPTPLLLSLLTTSKLQRADDIVAQLGGGADAIAAAIGMVTAEKNTNPFANNNVQNVCGDPSLPATAELRGITPLIDPAVDVNGAAAALSKSSAAAPLNADGMSVFDLMSANGLGDLVTSQAAAGGAAAGGNAGGNNQQANNNQNQGQANNNAGNNNQQAANNNQQAGGANQNANAGNGASCNVGNVNNGTDATQNAGNANQGQQNQNQNQNAGNNNQNAGNANQGAADNSTGGAATGGAAAGGARAAAGGADFGQCTPTIIFEAGQNGRKATEFTFQIADPLARGGQQDALNPNIITNALCNQLTNVCGANAAAVAACEDGKAQVQAAGTRDKSTADLFNAAVGFAGAVTNPDGGPADKPAAGAAAGNARKMRRGLRL